ncbi:MAG: hypothetical protein ACLUQW_09870 [Collinsella sp.]
MTLRTSRPCPRAAQGCRGPGQPADLRFQAGRDRVMGIDEAKAAGAVALFGEKYGDVVRVVSVGRRGPAVLPRAPRWARIANTAEIGLFKIIRVLHGLDVRRIEAVTSRARSTTWPTGRQLVDAAAAAR